MGFYSTKTSEEKRVKQLTGDIHLSEEFKEEIKNRDIPIYQGYNIQKRLRFEVEQGQLKGDEVDSRLMELLEENSKIMFQISTHRKLKKIPTVRTESPQDLKQMNLKYLQEPETEKHSARI